MLAKPFLAFCLFSCHPCAQSCDESFDVFANCVSGEIRIHKQHLVDSIGYKKRALTPSELKQLSSYFCLQRTKFGDQPLGGKHPIWITVTYGDKSTASVRFTPEKSYWESEISGQRGVWKLGDGIVEKLKSLKPN